MAIFFAAVGGSQEDLQRLKAAASAALGRELGDVPLQSAEAPGLFAVWHELGIWAPVSHHSLADGAVSLLAGEPILHLDGHRISQVDTLARYADGALPALLQQSHGTFCGVRLDLAQARVHAFTDKLGVRTLYTGEHRGIHFFTNARWLLQGLGNVIPLEPDPQGVMEIASMAFPLAERTRYRGIRACYGAELVEASAAGITKTTYHDWQDLTPLEATRPYEVELYETFLTAVRDRQGGAEEQTAFLSGGMDSRLIAASLAHSGIRLNTLNFAPSDTQDLTFGRMAAQALGARHFEFPLGPDNFDSKQIQTIDAWKAKDGGRNFDRRIWSGDGGSVGLGHVYLDEQIVRLAAERRYDDAAALLCRKSKWGIPSRALRPQYRELARRVQSEVAAEMRRWDRVPEKAAYLFLMLNDQRRHLIGHFETVHKKGFDFALPFFDARVIAKVLAGPNEDLLNHRVYNRILLALPGPIAQVPWQAYPGHDPCPVPVPSELKLRYQWEACYDEDDTQMLKDRHTAHCLRAALRPGSPLLSRTNLLAAWVLTKTGLRDQSFYGRYADALEQANR